MKTTISYFLLSVLLTTLCGLCLGAPLDDSQPSVPDMNKLIDQIVSALKAYQLLDPLALPQYHILLKKKVGSVQTAGHALLANTTITGLSAVHRRGNTEQQKDPSFSQNNQDSTADSISNSTFKVHLHMGQGNVKVDSTSAVHFSDSTYPNLKVAADIVDIAIHFTVFLGDGSTESGIADFTIDAFKFATFSVEGLPVGDPVVSGLSKSYETILNRKARQMLTDSIKPILEQELKNFSKMSSSSASS